MTCSNLFCDDTLTGSVFGKERNGIYKGGGQGNVNGLTETVVLFKCTFKEVTFLCRIMILFLIDMFSIDIYKFKMWLAPIEEIY